MDKCYSYGNSELFLLIALAAAKKYQINLDYSHLDSSSFSVHKELHKLLISMMNVNLRGNFSRNLFKNIIFYLDRLITVELL